MENSSMWRLSITYDSGSDAYPQQVNLKCTSLTSYDEFREQLCKELQIPIKAQFSIFVHLTNQKNEMWQELSNPQMLSTVQVNKIKIMPNEYGKKERKKKTRTIPKQTPKQSPAFSACTVYDNNSGKIPLHPLLQNGQQSVIYCPVVYYVQPPQQQQLQSLKVPPSFQNYQGQQFQTQSQNTQYCQLIQPNIQEQIQNQESCKLPSVQDITKFNF